MIIKKGWWSFLRVEMRLEKVEQLKIHSVSKSKKNLEWRFYQNLQRIWDWGQFYFPEIFPTIFQMPERIGFLGNKLGLTELLWTAVIGLLGVARTVFGRLFEQRGPREFGASPLKRTDGNTFHIKGWGPHFKGRPPERFYRGGGDPLKREFGPW